MPATVLDGKRIRDQILSELKPRADRLRRPPGLAVVLVGHDPASEIYVRGKIKASGDLGIYSEKITPGDSISTGDLLDIVEGLNQRSEIDGILVQVPLPPQIDSRRVLLAVDPNKDADGFHPLNVGNLVAGIPGQVILGHVSALQGDLPGAERLYRKAYATGDPDVAYGVATFYALFATKPRPPVVAHVCVVSPHGSQ